MIFNQEFGKAFYKIKHTSNGDFYYLWTDFQYLPVLTKEQFDNWIRDCKITNIKKISQSDVIQGGLKDKIESLNKFYREDKYDIQENLF
jgi:hypothetical protein